MAIPSNPNYRSYLLRLWRTNANTPWYASLISPLDGSRRSFATLEALYAYLNIAENDELPPSEQIEASDNQTTLQDAKEKISFT
ncbi:MAG: hypothetical protein ACOYYS_08230 [Chloroflexota bacterium]